MDRLYYFVRLQGTNVIQIFLFAFCDRASVLLIRSPSRNCPDPTFASNGRELVRRSDHFWVRSRVELNFEALTCHPRTTDERIRAPALGTCVFLSFFVFFRFFFLYPFKSRPSYKVSHSKCTNHYTSKDP